MGSETDLTVRSEKSGNTTILCLSGRVDGTNAVVLEKAIEQEIDGAEPSLLLDFEHLVYISSAGLRVLLIAARKMQAKSGKVVFCSLSEQIAQVFEVSGFNNILSVYCNPDEALAAI